MKLVMAISFEHLRFHLPTQNVCTPFTLEVKPVSLALTLRALAQLVKKILSIAIAVNYWYDVDMGLAPVFDVFLNRIESPNTGRTLRCQNLPNEIGMRASVLSKNEVVALRSDCIKTYERK